MLAFEDWTDVDLEVVVVKGLLVVVVVVLDAVLFVEGASVVVVVGDKGTEGGTGGARNVSTFSFEIAMRRSSGRGAGGASGGTRRRLLSARTSCTEKATSEAMRSTRIDTVSERREKPRGRNARLADETRELILLLHAPT